MCLNCPSLLSEWTYFSHYHWKFAKGFSGKVLYKVMKSYKTPSHFQVSLKNVHWFERGHAHIWITASDLNKLQTLQERFETLLTTLFVVSICQPINFPLLSSSCRKWSPLWSVSVKPILLLLKRRDHRKAKRAAAQSQPLPAYLTP